MKKNIITIAASLVLCLAANSQDVMKVELKNGQVATFPVENINRFYFEGAQQEELADDCEIEIEDEVVLTTCAAFEFSYDNGIEYVYAGYFTAREVRELTNDQIVTMLTGGGGIRLDKSDTMFGNSNLTEGCDYVLAYIGYNAQGKRGQLYLHPYTTSVLTDIQAMKLIAQVTNVTYDSNNFYFTVEADENLIGEYYIATEVGNDLTYMQENMAIFGLAWKGLMEIDEKRAGQHYFGDDFNEPRPNSENSLHVITWATDANWDLVGFIDESIWKTTADSRSMLPLRESVKLPNHSVFNKKQLIDQLNKSTNIYRVSKKQ